METERPDVVSLTRKLVAFDTINPPGNEAEAIAYCAKLLKTVGFDCDIQPRENGKRTNLIATKGTGDGAAIGFSGHLDTVPLGTAPWHYPPHEGVVAEGRIHGRGTSDMKGGVAAFLCACIEATCPPGGIAVLLTFGEETGCDGARALVESGALPPVGALIVAESTDNALIHGHKGVLWLSIAFTGKTAHGAMPDKGINAIELASAFLQRLDRLDLGPDHAVMGTPTRNIGTIKGGLNVNSVPDLCEVTLDIRTVPGTDHTTIMNQIIDLAGARASVTPLLDLAPVWTPDDGAFVQMASKIVSKVAGHEPRPASVNYFTDASILQPALGNPPTIILGPGTPECAHATDEWVEIDRLHEARTIMEQLIENWTGA